MGYSSVSENEMGDSLKSWSSFKGWAKDWQEWRGQAGVLSNEEAENDQELLVTEMILLELWGIVVYGIVP